MPRRRASTRPTRRCATPTADLRALRARLHRRRGRHRRDRRLVLARVHGGRGDRRERGRALRGLWLRRQRREGGARALRQLSEADDGGARRGRDTPGMRSVEEVARVPRRAREPVRQDAGLRDRQGLRGGGDPRRSRGQRGQAAECAGRGALQLGHRGEGSGRDRGAGRLRRARSACPPVCGCSPIRRSPGSRTSPAAPTRPTSTCSSVNWGRDAELGEVVDLVDGGRRRSVPAVRRRRWRSRAASRSGTSSSSATSTRWR